jgi:hypothetical protein
VDSEAAAEAHVGGGVPMGIGRGGGVGELRRAKAELLVWSVRAEDDRSYEFHGELGSPACGLDGGGVLERGSEEKAKGRGERIAGVFIVLRGTAGEAPARGKKRWRRSGATRGAVLQAGGGRAGPPRRR